MTAPEIRAALYQRKATGARGKWRDFEGPQESTSAPKKLYRFPLRRPGNRILSIHQVATDAASERRTKMVELSNRGTWTSVDMYSKTIAVGREAIEAAFRGEAGTLAQSGSTWRMAVDVEVMRANLGGVVPMGADWTAFSMVA